MRNIVDYEKTYDAESLERIQEQYRKKHIISLINKYDHDSVLEIGCGKEPLFIQFPDFKFMTVVEPSESFSNNAKLLAGNEKNIVVYNDFFENCFIDISKKSYDVIVISALLHELEDPLSFLKMVNKCCSDKTVIHVNVPNAKSIHRLLAYEMGLIEDVHQISETGLRLQQNSVFDIDSLKKLVTDANFCVLEQGSFIPKFFSYGQLKMMLDNGIVNEAYFEGMDKLIDIFPLNGSEIYLNIKRACE